MPPEKIIQIQVCGCFHDAAFALEIRLIFGARNFVSDELREIPPAVAVEFVGHAG